MPFTGTGGRAWWEQGLTSPVPALKATLSALRFVGCDARKPSGLYNRNGEQRGGRFGRRPPAPCGALVSGPPSCSRSVLNPLEDVRLPVHHAAPEILRKAYPLRKPPHSLAAGNFSERVTSAPTCFLGKKMHRKTPLMRSIAMHRG